MNPDTKLTVTQIKSVCEEHGIKYFFHKRIKTGFSHEVHRLNDDLVIKIYNPEDRQNFMTETALLGSSLEFPKPTLITTGTLHDNNRPYLIMNFVRGWSLGGRWHLATDMQRERLIKQICHSLKVINTADPKLIKANISKSWKETITTDCNKLVEKLVVKQIITPKTAEEAKVAISRYAGVLENNAQYVVFWDIHFDNFIVNDDFELQAVIDLESTSLASLDYPMFVLQKMSDMPHKYLREDEEKYANTKDYAKLKDWYRKYYPEMFNFNNLDLRLKFYQLHDVLHLLQDWSNNQECHEELARLIE